jgi:5,10-methylenetetrahydrofolate reductase
VLPKPKLLARKARNDDDDLRQASRHLVSCRRCAQAMASADRTTAAAAAAQSHTLSYCAHISCHIVSKRT